MRFKIAPSAPCGDARLRPPAGPSVSPAWVCVSAAPTSQDLRACLCAPGTALGWAPGAPRPPRHAQPLPGRPAARPPPHRRAVSPAVSRVRGPAPSHPHAPVPPGAPLPRAPVHASVSVLATAPGPGPWPRAPLLPGLALVGLQEPHHEPRLLPWASVPLLTPCPTANRTAS